jgi:tRNA-2-methylthio-N6-dimethylallyladenosine synthase
MNRGYTRQEYLDKVAMIRAGIPGVALSTDLIVGFPGETEEQFEDTMSLIETVRYENVYSFAYSPRPFTKAARFEEQLGETEKSRRLSTLIDRQRVIAFELAGAYNGGTYDVLFEEFKSEEQKWVGRTTHNKLVYATGDALSQSQNLIGQIRPVHVTKAAPTVLYGKISGELA